MINQIIQRLQSAEIPASWKIGSAVNNSIVFEFGDSTVPTGTGYRKGCIYIDSTNGVVYQNDGTTTTPSWTAILAAGDALTGASLAITAAITAATVTASTSVTTVALTATGVSSIDGADLTIANLPTSDPSVAGQIYSNLGVLTVSAG